MCIWTILIGVLSSIHCTLKLIKLIFKLPCSLYSEYIAGESNDKFWEFVDSVSALTPEQIHSGLYTEPNYINWK